MRGGPGRDWGGGGGEASARLLELAHAALGVLAADALDELVVGAALAEAALVVQGLQDLRHQREPRRRRLERAVVDLDALRLEEPSVGGEDGFVELLLQHLVDVVDAELLEGVDLEALEAEDVEDADRTGGVGAGRHRGSAGVGA